MSSELNIGNGSSETSRDWLCALVLRRGSGLMPRFLSYYRALVRRPRPWRRQLQRKLAVTVTGAALMLALAGGPVALAEPIETNAMINVVNGQVAISANGKCSLMEAIWNARSTTAGNMKADCTAGNPNGADTVVLPAGGNFVLTSAHNQVYGPTGLPVITSAVTIEGNGATIRRSDVEDTPPFRILAVDPVGSLTLRNTTISNGFILGETSELTGGGIYSLGTLTIEGSTISNNKAMDYGTGGGGIAAAGQTTITNSTIADNSTSGDGSGARGGGLLITGEGTATISGSTISNNITVAYWGAVGGGIVIAGQATITDSLISGNINWGSEGSGDGGGIFVSGNATIIGSTLTNNTAAPYFEWYSYDWHPGYGGGLSNAGQTDIINSTISGNKASYGGGISNNFNGLLTVTNSTLSNNEAYEYEYANFEYDSPEGGSGGGIFSGTEYGSNNCSSTTLRGVIVSGNTADLHGNQIFFDPDDTGYCTTTFAVNAFNVFGQGGASGLAGLKKGATDIIPSVGLAAILSPLADNGGPTQTHALPANSPALDLAPSNSCTAAPVNGVDQRGQPRNQNGAGGVTANECDAGSFEGGVPAPQPGFLVSAPGTGSVGGVAFAPADILKYDPATGWSMYFDGSDVGITKNLAAFEVLDNGHILMSFAANQPIAGLGTFKPQDIARFVPTSTGPATAGSFQRAFTGGANLLTTTGEKIDALGVTGDDRTALSTTGAIAVKLPNGTILKGQDEDVLGVNLNTGEWSNYFNGTAIPGLGIEDVNALWVDPATGDLYISIVGAFNLGGVGTPSVAGNGKDIVKLTKTPGAPGGYTPSLWWDGSVQGFPSTIDGLEMLP